MSDIDISREMVEHLCHIHRGYEQHGTVAMLLSLRAALDAAEADRRQAVLDERERCKGLIIGACEYLLDDGMPAYLDLSDIEVRVLLAAIDNQGEPK